MFGKAITRVLSPAVLLILAAVAAQADVMNMPNGQTNLETVWVVDKGNAADTTVMITDGTSGYGAVNYVYQMGKYEVTNAQYTQFLNAKLPTTSDAETGDVLINDTYGLYNRSMETQTFGGINYDPAGATGAKFSAKSAYENRPVNYVSWYDGIRFANWLQSGQGTGDTESGTYTITSGGQNVGTVSIPDAATRATWTAANKHWVLPSENEWYKSAYSQPVTQGGDTDSYWAYPTKSNTPPINTHLTPDLGNHANFYDNYGTGNNSYTLGSPYYTTPVGDFDNSASFYGTFDQGGNVYEWNEAFISPSRGLRGGSFVNGSGYLAASYRFDCFPTFENSSLGFRVANVPEPGSITMLLAGALGVLVWRRRRNA